eukprot:5828421-Prymnesium_polylepis.2
MARRSSCRCKCCVIGSACLVLIASPVACDRTARVRSSGCIAARPALSCAAASAERIDPHVEQSHATSYAA